jgi:hypothetical protein
VESSCRSINTFKTATMKLVSEGKCFEWLAEPRFQLFRPVDHDDEVTFDRGLDSGIPKTQESIAVGMDIVFGRRREIIGFVRNRLRPPWCECRVGRHGDAEEARGRRLVVSKGAVEARLGQDDNTGLQVAVDDFGWFKLETARAL